MVPPAPERGEHDEQDARDGRGENKAEPDIPFDFENAQKGKDRRGDHPHEGTGAQRPNETALPFLPLIPAGRFAVRVGGDEIVERHPVQFGKRFEHAKVGKPFAPLPFGDGFIRIIEFFGDLELGHARRLAAPHEILRERGFPIIHVFIITQIARKSMRTACISCKNSEKFEAKNLSPPCVESKKTLYFSHIER